MWYVREELTGRSRHRATTTGTLVLQVEVRRKSTAPDIVKWRDAVAEDLLVSNTIPESKPCA